MQSGIFWGYLSLIEGLVTRIRKEYFDDNGKDRSMDVIATGGLAPLFSDSSDMIRCADVELTLKGLYSLYRHNRKA